MFSFLAGRKEGVGDDENKQILDQTKAFFELHAHSRFYDLEDVSDQKIKNMAGYKAVYRDAAMFLRVAVSVSK
ncbi:MAG: hypothetical protein LBM19_01295 [Holosporales bacterium]|jgi:hypothetical protein|nr:hypothetical protein [Holosporales bacterium]